MKAKRLIICVSAAASLAMALIYFPLQLQTGLDAKQCSIDFPFEVKEETKSNSGFFLWEVSLILPKEHFSKNNLDRLFCYYSKKHPDRKEKMHVKVYTSLENWRQEREGIHLDFGTIGGSAISNDPKERWPLYDAIFYREGYGAMAGGGDKEWYIYSPDLNNPNETQAVILKGTLPFRSKNVIETWETTNKYFKIRVRSFDLEGINLLGTYYMFESSSTDSDDWTPVMAYRQDEIQAIPKEQVQYVSDQIAYLFMGSIYAVTRDYGRTWSVWDAERDIPTWQCCDKGIIQYAQITEDGTGKMTLKHISNQNEEVLELRTEDFGQHWSTE